jgi:NAD(P)H-dependent FMN reductase
VLVFPEYNHGYPGKFKTLLDTEFAEYKHKPVALVSVSSGQFGGVRAVEALIPVLTDFKMIVTGLNLHFPFIKEVFDEKGNLIDPKTKERIEKTLQELIYLTNVFKVGKRSVGFLEF